jgi:hypothetical protein
LTTRIFSGMNVLHFGWLSKGIRYGGHGKEIPCLLAFGLALGESS